MEYEDITTPDNRINLKGHIRMPDQLPLNPEHGDMYQIYTKFSGDPVTQVVFQNEDWVEIQAIDRVEFEQWLNTQNAEHFNADPKNSTKRE